MTIKKITNNAELQQALQQMQQMEADNQMHTEEFERLVTLVDEYKNNNNSGQPPESNESEN